MIQSLKEKQLSFTKLSFYDNYVVSEIKEGCYLNTELFDHVLAELDVFYDRTKRFVYISYRKADFNVNPVDYLSCDTYENMIAVAFVTETDSKKKTAEFEKNFIKKNTAIFNTLKEAIDWADNLIANK